MRARRRPGATRPGLVALPALVVLAGVVVLSGCTGVPTSSSPQTVEQLNVGAEPTEQSIRPQRGADPREIVTDFLRANTIDAGKHTSAKAFLTTAARSRWRDDQATIISDEAVGTYDEKTGQVAVTGGLVGKLDPNGIFTLPDVSDKDQTIYFKVVRDHGQNRIAGLQPGLLLSADEFAQNYKQHPLYFFDNAERYLVQDPRYTDIVDRTPLATWLLNRLAGGPRPALEDAVASDTFPTQTDPTRMTVEVDATTTVEIPGSRQLDANGRDRLAAQLSLTLDDPTSGGDVAITDGGRRVTIPAAHGTAFTKDDFTSELGRPAPAPEIYYISGGNVVTSSGKPLPGPLGRDTYGLTSVALSRPDPTGPLLVAGVQGIGPQAQLWVGSQPSGLKPTDIGGVTARPAFEGVRREVWVGSGSVIKRVTLSATGTNPRVSVVPFTPASTVKALRLSPDGARIAVVLGAAQSVGGPLYVGSIVRASSKVSISSLERISPPGVTIKDVAWLNPLRLFAIGTSSATQSAFSYDTGVDGTDWTARRVVGLPAQPDHVTVTAGANAWVSSADGFVWTQSLGDWVSPSGGQTSGTAPVYLE